jgi:hypothetical protein
MFVNFLNQTTSIITFLKQLLGQDTAAVPA